MSLEQKLSFLNRFKSALASSCAAYPLAVGLALGTAFYGCGKGDEPGEGNQRYSCQMNECVPDSKGPYAVSDCNNDCGEGNGGNDGGNGQQMDYLTITKDGMPQCPLGWTWTLEAHVAGDEINIYGQCASNKSFGIFFAPTPSPGGSSPCVGFREDYAIEGGAVTCTPATGSVTVTGTPGSFRVSGNCSCEPYSAEFSLPLRVL